MNATQLDSVLTYGIVLMIGMLAGILALLTVEYIRERRADARERTSQPVLVNGRDTAGMHSSVLPTVMQPR